MVNSSLFTIRPVIFWDIYKFSIVMKINCIVAVQSYYILLNVRVDLFLYTLII